MTLMRVDEYSNRYRQTVEARCRWCGDTNGLVLEPDGARYACRAACSARRTARWLP